MSGTEPLSANARQKVVFLLPIWGARYIDSFSEFGLRTLLAPGNIPAMSAEFDCEFIFLTRAEDIDVFDSYPPVQRLRDFCRVSFSPIDYLIVDTSYSATITIAFVNAVRARGEEMLDTYFVFLVADYIMADGSLSSLIPHLHAGRGAIQAGNFQVVEEDFLPLIADYADMRNECIAIPPRSLVRLALDHLHPVTFGNFPEVDILHTDHCNRLFWCADDDTIIARYFLLHMLCIRPEVTDFEIGSSCDYSFVPEMCPSGNWYTFSDSDEYLVVEHQPLLHESRHIKPGGMTLTDLAQLTALWATQYHRENILNTIIFHAAAPDADALITAQREAESYVSRLTSELKTPPQPIRGHPYWLGVIEGFKQAQQRKGSKSTAEWLTNENWHSVPERAGVRFLRWVFRRLFGTPPFVRPWHQNWIEYRAVTRMLKHELAGSGPPMMVVSEEINPFSKWLLADPDRAHGFQTTRLIRANDTYVEETDQKCGSCFVFLQSNEILRMPKIIKKVRRLLMDDARIIVYCQNDQAAYLFNEFRLSILLNAPKLAPPGFRVARSTYTYSNTRLLTDSAIAKSNEVLHRHQLWGIPFLLLLLIPVYTLVVFDNVKRALGMAALSGYCTSVTLEIQSRR